MNKIDIELKKIEKLHNKFIKAIDIVIIKNNKIYKNHAN